MTGTTTSLSERLVTGTSSAYMLQYSSAVETKVQPPNCWKSGLIGRRPSGLPGSSVIEVCDSRRIPVQ